MKHLTKTVEDTKFQYWTYLISIAVLKYHNYQHKLAIRLYVELSLMFQFILRWQT